MRDLCTALTNLDEDQPVELETVTLTPPAKVNGFTDLQYVLHNDLVLGCVFTIKDAYVSMLVTNELKPMEEDTATVIRV